MAYVLVPLRVFTSATQPCSMEVDTRRLVTMPKKKKVCSQHQSLSQERVLIHRLGVMTGEFAAEQGSMGHHVSSMLGSSPYEQRCPSGLSHCTRKGHEMSRLQCISAMCLAASTDYDVEFSATYISSMVWALGALYFSSNAMTAKMNTIAASLAANLQ